MGSFKLEKGGSAKDQARTGGIFLAIVGVVVALFVWPVVGWVMAVLGLLFFAASFVASE